MKMTHILRTTILLLSLSQPACRTPRGNPHGIQVLEESGGRKLMIGGRVRAYVDTASLESRLRYVSVMNLPMRFYSAPGSLLLIGAGGGSIARNYLKEGWKVESVEPDSAVARIARSSFGLREDEVKIRVGSAGQFLASQAGAYDLILEDLVGTPVPEGDLLTAGFFKTVRTHSKKGGMFGIALECAGWRDEVVRAVASTLGEAFPNVTVLPIAEPPNRFGSIVVIASERAHDELVREVGRNEGLDPEWRFGPGYQETHAWDNRFVMQPDPLLVQTAEQNRIGRMFETIDDSARAQPPGYLP